VAARPSRCQKSSSIGYRSVVVLSMLRVLPDRVMTVEGLLLTAEEIKDVVSSTGLWLVVRESIGGVGKINRKGDGWRIRA
jgi:hypothetical protein